MYLLKVKQLLSNAVNQLLLLLFKCSQYILIVPDAYIHRHHNSLETLCFEQSLNLVLLLNSVQVRNVVRDN